MILNHPIMFTISSEVFNVFIIKQIDALWRPLCYVSLMLGGGSKIDKNQWAAVSYESLAQLCTDL